LVVGSGAPTISNHPYSQYGADHVDDSYIHLQKPPSLQYNLRGQLEFHFTFYPIKVVKIFRNSTEYADDSYIHLQKPPSFQYHIWGQ
jgi:hypothetical protein